MNSLKTPIRFCLAGGDNRQLSLRTLLARDGHTVTDLALSDSPIALSSLTQADCLLLPLPATLKNSFLFAPLHTAPIPLSGILDVLHPGQLIFGGKITPFLYAEAEKRGLQLHDFLAREDFSVSNAVPTAEGALQHAMEHLPITIHQSRVLITGFGRVGACTAQRFHAMGAHVTVAARSPAQLALAETMGCRAVPLTALADTMDSFDLVINTIPAPVLTAPILHRSKAPLLLELASPPGGFELPAVHDLGLQLINAQGLPGKVAPVTAAHIIRNTLYQALEELHFGKEGSS